MIIFIYIYILYRIELFKLTYNWLDLPEAYLKFPASNALSSDALEEWPGGSWADGTLKALGYDTNPTKLQTVMRQVYAHGVSRISMQGTEVLTVPLYEVLDGKDTLDYVARVEPSDQGGHKLAKAVVEAMKSSGQE